MTTTSLRLGPSLIGRTVSAGQPVTQAATAARIETPRSPTPGSSRGHGPGMAPTLGWWGGGDSDGGEVDADLGVDEARSTAKGVTARSWSGRRRGCGRCRRWSGGPEQPEHARRPVRPTRRCRGRRSATRGGRSPRAARTVASTRHGRAAERVHAEVLLVPLVHRRRPPLGARCGRTRSRRGPSPRRRATGTRSAPRPTNPPGVHTSPLYVSGGGRPRVPDTRTRSSPRSSRVSDVKSATTSG